MKDTRTFEQRVIDLETVLTFSIVNSIRRGYCTLDNFKKAYSSITSGHAHASEQVKFCSMFTMDNKLIRRILGYFFDEDNKKQYYRQSDAVAAFKTVKYRPHFNKKYKSGRIFKVHSYYYIPFETLEILMADDKILDLTSGKYTKLQRAFINELIIKETNMTKEEEAKYIEEYERGEHMLTLEQYKREEAKKARSKAKSKSTRLKHAAEELATTVMTPMMDMIRQKDAIIAELNEKITKLSEENARLKAAANEIRYKTMVDMSVSTEARQNASKTTPETSESVSKPQVLDSSDIPMDVFSASTCARKYGEKGIKLVKALDKAALSGSMYFETANRYARALGLEKTYNFTTVVPPTSQNEVRERERLRKVLDKVALQIGCQD